ncbi:MAG: glycosyltransferase [Candidatus Bathyarchaeia archaeon]|nr:glycosyltransferase [Candidatus Bathyarchaeia archaeon]
MRILHVTYIFPPKAEVADGITQVVYRVTRALAKKGHDVTIYASNALDLHGRERAEIDSSSAYIDGVKVRYFPYLLRYGTIFFTPSMFYSVRDDIKEFDVIHIHDARCLQCAVTAYYAELFNVPVVFQPHGSFKSPFPSGRLRKLSRIFIDTLYAEKIFKKASKIVTLSQTEAQQYRGMGVPDEKIAVIPNGIDLSEYGDLPPKGFFKKKFSINDDEKIILYLGRIHESKGLDLLTHAFKIVSKDLSNVRLVVVGPDDGYAATFSKLISDLGIKENALLTGFVDKRALHLCDDTFFLCRAFYS